MNGTQNVCRNSSNNDARRENAPEKHHSLFAKDRHTMTIHGVTDVVSFDENGVFLVTICGQLNLEGSGLHVNVLDTEAGVVEVTGTLNGLLYYDIPQESGKHKKGKRINRFFS